MSAVKRTALAVASAALLLPTIAVPVTAAHADGRKPASDDKPKPPPVMSTVGGERLGLPGTQVNLAPGVPVLPKALSGRSWIVADAESGQVLAAHNAHWRLAPASTLKMLFADTVLPRLPKDQVHTVKPEELTGVGSGSSKVGVKENHTYKVHDLWLGVFLRSGNDAVHVLTAMNGGPAKTVGDMNAHARELQAVDTKVVSPDGYDAPGQVSSAYDLTLIARSGMQKKDFREYASTVRARFPGGMKDGKREDFEIQSTNRLLTGEGADVDPYPGIAGVKNGTTTHAGSTFTGVAQNRDRVLLVTVMNPQSHERQAVYNETARLFDWGFAAAGKVKPVGELVPPRSADLRSGKNAPPSGKAAKSPAPVELASAEDGSSGMGIALAVAGGVLLVLAGAVFLVNRRWPVPALARRAPRR
ncbi:D-alanyl-D-alanine carboxypeptidase family protein [Streptomyces candidus]|uniref:D-alanyl-D-alanine carboxypeptidase (Penicillin-binding protein 5/6) n=1 Tax=Streptomyces candidus TaxID=67283 RepID=A0A7X0HCC9_9ACTN|nr:D-alanyl-D-alanine carboxypeptidase (penicillin-binding protein 5/6) [Streptomyces candidus]